MSKKNLNDIFDISKLEIIGVDPVRRAEFDAEDFFHELKAKLAMLNAFAFLLIFIVMILWL